MTDWKSYLSHLECGATGDRIEADRLHNLSPAGKPILARYDLDALAKGLDRRLNRMRRSGRTPLELIHQERKWPTVPSSRQFARLKVECPKGHKLASVFRSSFGWAPHDDCRGLVDFNDDRMPTDQPWQVACPICSFRTTLPTGRIDTLAESALSEHRRAIRL